MDKIIPKQSYNLLKSMIKYKDFDIKSCDLSYIKILEESGFIKIHKKPSPELLLNNSKCFSYIHLTTSGKIYVSSYQEFHRQTLINRTLSIIAIIISVIALVMPIMM